MVDDFTDLIPENSVILNVVRVVEFMDEEGVIQKLDLSYGSDGEEVSVGKSLELIEWCRAFTLSGIYMEMLTEFIHDACDEEED